MKKLFLIASLIACAFTSQAVVTPLIQGNLYTNATVLVGRTNYQYGVVFGAWTNTYNLATTVGAQANTNLWPSVGYALDGYPGTLYGPSSIENFQTSAYLVATNASSTAVLFKYAGSNDGVSWVSNLFQVTYTVGVNTLTPGPIQTNYNAGAIQYIALQSIENPGVAALTNVVLNVGEKSGL